MSLCEDNDNNYKKLAQFEAALTVDLSYRPRSFDNLLRLNEDFDINYRIPDSCFIKSSRPGMIGMPLLSVAAIMSQNEIFQILLNRGADFTVLSPDGQTVAHMSVRDDYKELLSSLKRHGSVYEDEFAEMSLRAHVDRDISKNPRDSHGVSHFHIASMANEKEAVEYFLKNEVKIDEAVEKDSPELPGFTALHFAAKYASYKTAEILLNYGANMHLKDARGMSALHVLVEERLRSYPAAFRMQTRDRWFDRSISDYFQQNGKMLKLFLKNFGNNIDDVGLSNLHVACTLKDTSAVKLLLYNCNVDVNLQIHSDSVIRPGYTALHFAAAVCDEETFVFLLDKGANMEMKDVNGVSPFDLSLSYFKVSSIHSILLHHPTWETIVFSDGETKLLDFIRAMQTSKGFQLFLSENVKDINMFVPLDSPICAGYTPLHLCVICSEKPPNYNEPKSAGYPTVDLVSYDPEKTSLYGTRIKYCLQMNANICIQDTRGSSPLHWAFVLQETSLVNLLLGYHEEFDNPSNEDGLTHLHIASALGNELVVMKLLLKNLADLNSQSRINYSWYFAGSNRFVVKSGSTPLHFAAVTGCLKVTKILLKCDADILAVDHDNFNPLERLLGARLAVDTKPFYQEPYNEMKRSHLVMLIGRLSQVLIDSADASEILLCCYKLLRTDSLMLILQSENKLRDEILSNVGLSKLHVACLTNNINAVRELLKAEDVDIDVQVDEKSPIWSEMTPLCCYIDGRRLRDDKNRDFSIAKMLLQRGADVMRIRSGSSVVHQAFDIHCHQQMTFEVEVPREDCRKDLRLVKLLLSFQQDFSVNPTASSGLSHFHIACACNNHEMAMEFLKNGADVNQKIDYFCQQYGGDTPLHMAAIYKSKETVDVLLKHGADVHSTNSYNGTPLHVAAKTRFENSYIMEALLSAGADVNAQSIIGATPVELLMDYRNITKDEIDMCLKNGFRVDVINPVTGQGSLGQALREQRNSEFAYKMFFESTDLAVLDRGYRNAIHNVVSVERPNRDDIDKHDVLDEAFIPAEDYTKVIGELIKLNLNVDQQDTEGKTPLHYAIHMQNVTAILGLLNNGADINISNTSGQTALAHYIQLDKESFDHYFLVDRRILQIFMSHAYKLASLDLDVDAFIRELLSKKLHKERKILRSSERKCRKELAKLRVKRIKSSSVTLDDFLSETSVIVNFSRLPLKERHAVEKFFAKKMDYLRDKYPEFAGILLLQYRKALKRINIIPVALDSFSVLVGFRMPYVCSDIILQYLSNDNLNNLIAAACL